ncbi:MAG TPA: hypothetical protein VK460_06820 [Burkholderiales bacterium]|nr:hypothetical protein [Burkholderiales bacterium]
MKQFADGLCPRAFFDNRFIFMAAYLTRMEDHVAGMTGTGHAPFAATFPGHLQTF